MRDLASITESKDGKERREHLAEKASLALGGAGWTVFGRIADLEQQDFRLDGLGVGYILEPLDQSRHAVIIVVAAVDEVIALGPDTRHAGRWTDDRESC